LADQAVVSGSIVREKAKKKSKNETLKNTPSLSETVSVLHLNWLPIDIIPILFVISGK
jgi:hypothetical protein